MWVGLFRVVFSKCISVQIKKKMNKIFKWVVVAIIIIIAIQYIILLSEGVCKYFLLRELPLLNRYGHNSYVVITGAGSGQGKLYAQSFAKRGFHLIILGSERCFKTAEHIQSQYPFVDVRVLIVDFGNRESTLLGINSLFDMIRVQNLNVSVLINNVGKRSAANPSYSLNETSVLETINAGTIPQVLLTHRFIPYFQDRRIKYPSLYSAIIFITAQCVHPTIGPGIRLSNMISVPYLSVYEATNTFGCFHANSISEECKGQGIDFLNVTPGGTITENTEPFMKQVPFSVPQEELVDNVFRMLGQVQGTTSAHWKHAAALYLVNLAPWEKQIHLNQIGQTIAKHYDHTRIIK